jgi:signal transduction histidine kinase
VRGHLEVLDPNNPVEVLETRSLAIEELDRISALVEDLTLLAETEKSAPSFQRVDLATFTRQVFAKVAVLPDHVWELGETAQITCSIDPHRITQAWLQLADNAAKYSPTGSPIELGSNEHDGGLELWVSDHGPGIPAEALERVFERFGRADTGRGVGGSGLGLSIVQAIAVSHGGRVTFEPTGSGTRFSIRLPQEPDGAMEALKA